MNLATLTAPSKRLTRWGGWAIVALLLGWMVWGALPFSPVEGDEMAVVNGLHLRASGDLAWQKGSYLYTVQPGSYWVIIAASRLGSADFFTAFALVSVVSAVAFVLLAGLLLARVQDIPWPWAICAIVLLAQETSAAAAYANTSTFAGIAALGGLVMFKNGSTSWRAAATGVGLGLAGWLRFDALLIAPTVAVLATPNAKGIRSVVIATLTAVLVLAAAYLASGVRLPEIWQTYAAKEVDLGYGALLKNLPFLLSYSGIVLGLAGVCWLMVRREWRLLVLVVVGVAPSVVVHGRSITTTKYLYYTVPFLLLPAVALVRHIQMNRVLKLGLGSMLPTAAVVSLIGLEWLIGPRTTPDEIRRLPVITLAALGSWAAQGNTHAVVLGSGDAFMNDDGLRVRGGLAFAPFVWRAAKVGVLSARSRLSVLMRTPTEFVLIATSMNSFNCAGDLLWTAGYHPDPKHQDRAEGSGDFQSWVRLDRHVDLGLIVYDDQAAAIFARLLVQGVRAPGAAVLNDRGFVLARDVWPASSSWPRPDYTPLGFMNLFERP